MSIRPRSPATRWMWKSASAGAPSSRRRHPEARVMAEPLVDVRNLAIRLVAGQSQLTLVDDVSFAVAAGEVLCIVGESGCGKTVTARSIIGLNRSDPRFDLGGQILFGGRDLMQLDDAGMRG